MKIWKYSKFDSLHFGYNVFQLVYIFYIAGHWDHYSLVEKFTAFGFLSVLMVYNIIVIAHFFTHTGWFSVEKLNIVASWLVSFNIGQSAKAYQLTHVRNHHRHNNDRHSVEEPARDFSSTFIRGKAGQHATLFQYAVYGALESLFSIIKNLAGVIRFWTITENEPLLLELAAKSQEQRIQELRQIAWDRAALYCLLLLLTLISVRVVLFCYFPAIFLAFLLVNVQNYYEHFGANPEDIYANSVSYYGKFYNLIAFNDGYHQEHHLKPAAHWTTLPSIYRANQDALSNTERLISSVPAIFGFLDRKRPLLHNSKNGN